MIELIGDYLDFFLRPFSRHREMRKIRFSGRLQIVDELASENKAPQFTDFLSISWVFVMIAAFYGLFSLILGHYLRQDHPSSFLFSSEFVAKASQITILGILLEVIFYPLSIWIYVKFWNAIIKFFGKLYGLQGDLDELAEEVSTGSLVGHFFLIIPIFGPTVKNMASLFYLFAGLRANMGMGTAQSFVVILTPFLLLMGLIVMMLLYFVIIFQMLT